MTPLSEAERQQARYQWLTPVEVGERCGGVTAEQVRGWIQGGLLKALDISKAEAKRHEYKIKPEWVEEFLKKRTRNGEAA